MSLKINHITNTLQVDDAAASANLILAPKGTGFVDLSGITLASNATNTGALVVGGGIGVGGSMTVGGSLTVQGTINASITGVITTATNLAGGSAGQIVMQNAAGSTTFIPSGAAGSVLQASAGNTSTFVSTTTLQVGYATNQQGGSVNATTGAFSGITTFTNPAPTSSAITGALQITGGVGIAGSLYVGGIVTTTNLTLNANTIALGNGAGQTGQNAYAVAVGSLAGNTNQGGYAVAVGIEAGQTTQGQNAIAIGQLSGNTGQGTNAVAIGIQSGQTSQGANAVAVGINAGLTSQGQYAVAIGPNAGNSNQPANSIIFNASSVALNGTNAGFYVAPIRADATSSGTSIGVFYNAVTKELTTSSTGIIAGSAGTATNIANGSAGQIVMQNGFGSTTFIPSGAAGTVLQAQSGNTSTFVSTGTMFVGNALNVVGGSAGQIHMQNAAGVTTFIQSGAAGTLLQAGASNTATFVSTSSIRVGYADSVNNIIGGAIGSIPYQTAAGTTAFIPMGTTGYVLTAGATTASWTAVSGITAGNSTTATNLAGGSAGQIHMQNANGSTTFIQSGAAGTLLQAGAGNTSTFVSTGSIRVGYADSANSAGSATSAGLANNIAGGLGGQMPIQTSAGVTTFIPAGTNGQVLTYGTNTATWSSSVGSSASASNLAGGAQYQVPYQSGVGATAFSANHQFDGTNLFLTGGSTQLNTGFTNKLNVSGSIVAGSASGSTAGTILLQGNYGANGSITNLGTEYSTGGPVIGYGVYPSTISAGSFFSSQGLALTRGAYTVSGNVHNWYIGASQTVTIGNPATMTLAMTLNANGALAFNGASNYGSSGQILQSNGNGPPTWVALSGVSSGSANIANNLANGSAGQIPYQSAANSTSFSSNLTWDGSNLNVNSSPVVTKSSAASTGLTAYDLSNFINGKPLSNEIVMRVMMVRSCSFAGNFAGSYAVAGTAPTAAAGVSMIIYKQGVAIGTLTFAQNSTSGVFTTTGGSAISFIAGNQLVIQVDNSVNGQDPAFSDMALTLFGTVAV